MTKFDSSKIRVIITGILLGFCVIILYTLIFDKIDEIFEIQRKESDINLKQSKFIEEFLENQNEIVDIIQKQSNEIDHLNFKIDSLELKLSEFDNELTEIFD